MGEGNQGSGYQAGVTESAIHFASIAGALSYLNRKRAHLPAQVFYSVGELIDGKLGSIF